MGRALRMRAALTGSFRLTLLAGAMVCAAARAALSDDGCPTWTGQVRESGHCVCPPGTREISKLDRRCVSACPAGSEVDCSLHDEALREGRDEAKPGAFCVCRPTGPAPTPIDRECDLTLSGRLSRGSCRCLPGTEARRDGRCVPRCPEGRETMCNRLDEALRNGAPRTAVSPLDLCDCVPRRGYQMLVELKEIDERAGPPLTHCPPVTGERLENGACVCPTGTSRANDPDRFRCLERCDGFWDCSEHDRRIYADDLSVRPDELCRCRPFVSRSE